MTPGGNREDNEWQGKENQTTHCIHVHAMIIVISSRGYNYAAKTTGDSYVACWPADGKMKRIPVLIGNRLGKQ